MLCHKTGMETCSYHCHCRFQECPSDRCVCLWWCLPCCLLIRQPCKAQNSARCSVSLGSHAYPAPTELGGTAEGHLDPVGVGRQKETADLQLESKRANHLSASVDFSVVCSFHSCYLFETVQYTAMQSIQCNSFAQYVAVFIISFEINFFEAGTVTGK